MATIGINAQVIRIVGPDTVVPIAFDTLEPVTPALSSGEELVFADLFISGERIGRRQGPVERVAPAVTKRVLFDTHAVVSATEAERQVDILHNDIGRGQLNVAVDGADGVNGVFGIRARRSASS